MKRCEYSSSVYRRAGFALMLVVFSVRATIATGAIIHESATLAGEGTETLIGSYVLDYSQQLGSRFHIDAPVDVTSIGGHMIGEVGTFYGAIVELDAPGALPVGNPLDPSEVLAYGTFSYSSIFPSTDFRMALSISLDPGDYAVVFGSGVFGTDGIGGMPHAGQSDLPGASYITWGDTTGWYNTTSTGMRFVVEGTVIPEPSTALVLCLGFVWLLRRRERSVKERA
jgi:hypothetical protein